MECTHHPSTKKESSSDSDETCSCAPDASARPFIEALWAIAARLEREEHKRPTRDKSATFDSVGHIPNA
jgi:hypothetical protein